MNKIGSGADWRVGGRVENRQPLRHGAVWGGTREKIQIKVQFGKGVLYTYRPMITEFQTFRLILKHIISFIY